MVCSAYLYLYLVLPRKKLVVSPRELVTWVAVYLPSCLINGTSHVVDVSPRRVVWRHLKPRVTFKSQVRQLGGVAASPKCSHDSTVTTYTKLLRLINNCHRNLQL